MNTPFACLPLLYNLLTQMSNICSHIFKKNLHLCTTASSGHGRRSIQTQITTVRRRAKRRSASGLARAPFPRRAFAAHIFFVYRCKTRLPLQSKFCRYFAISSIAFKFVYSIKNRRELVCGGAKRRRTRL